MRVSNSLNTQPELLNSLDNLAARRATWEAILARPEQLPTKEGDWSVWLYLAGRGAGKTRTAAEWIVWQALTNNWTRWAVIAPTFGDVRDTCAEGESGLIPILHQYGALEYYNRSTGDIKLTNGSRIKLFSADEPDRLRGPQHHGAWCDELAAWRYPDTYDQLQFGLRLGDKPRTIITTTPRPVPLIRQLVAKEDGTVKVIRGSTFDNAANLAPSALVELQARYNGTRLGRQELYGEILDDVEGALWTRGVIDRNRLESAPALARIAVSIDPAVTNTKDSDETGIIVVGSDAAGNGYVLADYSFKGSPNDWAQKAVAVFREHKADSILVEVNQGGDMVTAVLRQVDMSLPIQEVRAHVGKKLRAEPVAAMYEQGRIKHVGEFDKLEEQMTSWTPDSADSPDRLDAMVQGFSHLIGTSSAASYFSALANFCTKCGLPMPKSASRCFKCGTAMITQPEIQGAKQ